MTADDFTRAAVGLHVRLVRAVAAVCGDVALAEECAQEALLRAWERVDGGAELRSLEAWTVRVALNWCRSQQRRRGAEDRALQRLRPVADATNDPRPVGDEVMTAIADIATAVDTSTGAVKNALFHARAALATRLAATHEQEEPA